jgi:hypothetical protein
MKGSVMRFQNRNSRAAKLTEVQVVEMRARYAKGETQSSLSRVYQVSLVQVGRIVRGESWQHTPGAPGRERLSEEDSLEWARKMLENGGLRDVGEELEESAKRAFVVAQRVEEERRAAPPPLESFDPGDDVERPDLKIETEIEIRARLLGGKS